MDIILFPETIKALLAEYGFTVVADKTLSDLNPLYFVPVGRGLRENEIFNLEHSVIAKKAKS